MQDAKEEVRARLNIEDVIGEYVQLKRAGRNFKGLSPFGDERTPSFFVSPDKQIWHDFSANRGGDIFSFIMEVEGLDFRGSLEFLARKAGVDLSLYQTAGNQKLAQRKQRLLEAHVLATRYYQMSLVKNPRAVEYVFHQRQLSKEVVTEFAIGYAPDNGQALLNFLTKKGFDSKTLADAGLLNRYGSDLFRGRMMVPLMDTGGQVIGFTGRIIGEVENAPKYLNTSQTLLYDKGRHVFGLSQAKDAIRTSGHVVIVEGNLDVVSSHQAGVKQVVATAGTAMTEHHLRALKRLASDIRLCFDGDKAGIAATERAIGIAAAVEVELTIISLPPEAKDPDELIKRNLTAWQRAIERAVPAVEWVIAQYAEREDLTTAAGKRAFTNASLALIARLRDSVEQEHYEDMVAEKIGSSRRAIHSKSVQLAAADQQTAKKLRPIKATATPEQDDQNYPYQDDLLALGSITPQARELFGSLDYTLLAGEARQQLAHYLATHTGIEADSIPKSLHDIETYVKIVLLRADTRFADWSDDDRYYETARLIRQLHNEHKKQKRDQLTLQLRDAEASEDESAARELRSALNTLIKEIAREQ